MKRELDNLLCERYPKLFVDRNKPMTESAMYWGFSCGDGWFNIIDTLCNHIQSHIDWKNKTEEVVPQVVVQQVKEKFGTLSFYYQGGDEYIYGLVAMAEGISGRTCETCGAPGERGGRRWIKTLCETHRAESEARYKETIEG